MITKKATRQAVRTWKHQDRQEMGQRCYKCNAPLNHVIPGLDPAAEAQAINYCDQCKCGLADADNGQGTLFERI